MPPSCLSCGKDARETGTSLIIATGVPGVFLSLCRNCMGPGVDRMEAVNDLVNLVRNFSDALLLKLLEAEVEHSWRGQWKRTEVPGLRDCLREHMAKGDPLDVAAFAAFLWHRDKSTS